MSCLISNSLFSRVENTLFQRHKSNVSIFHYQLNRKLFLEFLSVQGSRQSTTPNLYFSLLISLFLFNIFTVAELTGKNKGKFEAKRAEFIYKCCCCFIFPVGLFNFCRFKQQITVKIFAVFTRQS